MAAKFKILLGLTVTLTMSLTPANAEKVLQGEVCSARVHALTTAIDWQKNLDDAEEIARKENKLIFWMHMLGKIDGAT
jgi:hypothetical protein